jgi:hypothetical protein
MEPSTDYCRRLVMEIGVRYPPIYKRQGCLASRK